MYCERHTQFLNEQMCIYLFSQPTIPKRRSNDNSLLASALKGNISMHSNVFQCIVILSFSSFNCNLNNKMVGGFKVTLYIQTLAFLLAERAVWSSTGSLVFQNVPEPT